MKTEEPLTVDQFKTFHKIAVATDNDLEQFVADVVPYTGFTINALSHLREDWIDWDQEKIIRVHIPAKDDCTAWKDGWGNFIKQRGRPCRYCRRRGKENKFERFDLNPANNTPQSRTVTISCRLAEPAVKQLEDIFKRRNRTAVGVSTNSIRRAIKRLVSKSSINRRVTYQDLVKTQIAIYTNYDVDLGAIVELSPYSERKVRSIIHRTPNLSHPDINYLSDEDFLTSIDALSPVSSLELANELNKDKSTIITRLQKLEDRGRVEIVEKPSNPDPYLWDVTISPQTQFRCKYDCDYLSPSLQGIRKHEKWSH
jgi:DNA-binding Lrp family transcriptional regulator